MGAEGALRWRNIGPQRGGRCVAVAGDPAEPRVFYFGAVNGGVWKTESGGITWRNVSDGFFRSASVGAVAVAPSDRNVVVVGMGEACIRGNVSSGDGVYRSDDGGATWRHLGLADTRHIARVRIDPRDPDRIYVAALGHAFGPNPERGVYRTTDGGAHWQRVLYVDDTAGACDLSLDPLNPRILYAAIWRARRTPYSLDAGGPPGGLFRSADGGDTWTDLTAAPGMPEGAKGRIGVSASGARPGRVFAAVEAEEGGLFRSDDGGAHWERVSAQPGLRQRPWYYQHVFADPSDAETVYVLNVEAFRSVDGGRTFTAWPAHHGDHHDLWIDPRRPGRMIQGHDGGAQVTYDGGLTWSSVHNQPTAQFYHVTTDRRFPYRVYGAQQDNTTLCVPSRSDLAAIDDATTYAVGGGECGYIQVRPDQPDVVYAGNYGLLTRFDGRTRQSRNITPWPDIPLGWGAGDLKYRLQWTFPVLLSPHDPDTLYVGANVLFRSRDEGQTWQVVSPDLTRADPERMQPSGGPITKDNTGAEYYCTIFALAESPLQQGVLWAGSDDGLVHLSRDGGATWTKVTPPDLPEWSLVSMIEASPHDAATAYLAATRYKLDDFRPYLFRTRDYGQTWQEISDGIPDDEATRAVRADPARPGLLYCGTERGAYVSFDDGDRWRPLGAGLPVVPVHDLEVHDEDLVAATHGRGFWILDDVTPLRQPEGAASPATVHLFVPAPALRLRVSRGWARMEGAYGFVSTVSGTVSWERRRAPDGELAPVFTDAGENRAPGALVTYTLPEAAAEPVTLEFLDAGGAVVRRFTSAPPEAPAGEGAEPEPRLAAAAGTHRFVWDLRTEPLPPLPEGMFWSGQRRGPMVPPGTYLVRLTVGDAVVSQVLTVRSDPRVETPSEDLAAQYDLLRRIQASVGEGLRAARVAREVSAEAQRWAKRLEGTEAAATAKELAQALTDALAEVAQRVVQTKARHGEDLLNFPSRATERLSDLAEAVAMGDFRPTDAMEAAYAALAAEVEAAWQDLRQVLAERLEPLNALVAQAQLPPVAGLEDGRGHGAR
jgi:photosystem II stability/assembly factor-like uncharacterized protein